MPYPGGPSAVAPYPMGGPGGPGYPPAGYPAGMPPAMPPAGIPGAGMGMVPGGPAPPPPPFLSLPGIGEDGRLVLKIEVVGGLPCDRSLYINANGIPLYTLGTDPTAGCCARCTGRAKVFKSLHEGGRPIVFLRFRTGCVPSYDCQVEVPNGSGGTRMVPMRICFAGNVLGNNRSLVVEDIATGAEAARSEAANLTATEETIRVAGILVAKSKRPMFQLRFQSTLTIDMNALVMAWNRPGPETMRWGASVQAVALLAALRIAIMMRM